MSADEFSGGSPDLLTKKRKDFWNLWKRRGLLIFALLILVIPLYGTFSPLFEFILFAVSLSALTYPVFYRPIDGVGKRLFPKFAEQRRSEITAVISTLLLLSFILSPIFLLIFEASDAKRGVWETLFSIGLGEESGKAFLLESVRLRVQEIKSIYPQLPIDEKIVVQFVSNLVGDTRQFSGTFMEFLFKGTRGFVAELALALIALSFLYAHGKSFLKRALSLGGFHESEIKTWFELHRKITFRLLSDTVLTSLIRGFSLALVAHFVGGFFFLPVFLLGAFVGLVPVVGSAMVWLPLSSLVWSQGKPATAVILALLSLFLNYLISRARVGMGQRLHQQGAWLSFLLFLGIIGGILSYGPQGFVIGPMAVVLAYGLVRFLASQSKGKMVDP